MCRLWRWQQPMTPFVDSLWMRNPAMDDEPMDSTTGSGAAGGMDLRFEAHDNIIHGPDMCCLLACQEAVTCLQGDLLVAALSECVKAFRRHSTTWSCGWELRRSCRALVAFHGPRGAQNPFSSCWVFVKLWSLAGYQEALSMIFLLIPLEALLLVLGRLGRWRDGHEVHKTMDTKR